MHLKKVAITALSFVLSLCLYSAVAAAESTGHAPHWAYEGEAGPDKWGSLSPGFSNCSRGKTQSPVDISDSSGGDPELTEPDFFYQPLKKVNIVNNGHTIQVDYKNGSTISINGMEFELAQFHFHAPSEHTLNGKSYDAELHLVHKNDEGKLAVVGVLMGKGKENAALAKIWPQMPKNSGDKKELSAFFNAADLLPADKGYYTYPGSLTTPPCSESVVWIVLKTPIEMSEEQIKEFKAIFDKNNRPVQPLNKRTIRSTKF